MLVGEQGAPEQAADAAAVAWLIESSGAPSGRGAGGREGGRYAASALGKLRGGRGGRGERAPRSVGSGGAQSSSAACSRTRSARWGRRRTAAALRGCQTDDPELKRLVGRGAPRASIGRFCGRGERDRRRGVARSPVAGRLSVPRRARVDPRRRAREEASSRWIQGSSPRAVEEGRVQAVLRGPLSGAFAAADGALVRAPPRAGVGDRRGDAGGQSLGLRRGVAHPPRVHARADPLPARVRVRGGTVAASFIAWRARLRTARPEDHERPDGQLVGGARARAPRLAKGTRARSQSSSSRARSPTSASPTASPTFRRPRTRRSRPRSRASASARPDDVVWDPFVGSGLELIERARLGPVRCAARHGHRREGARSRAREPRPRGNGGRPARARRLDDDAALLRRGHARPHQPSDGAARRARRARAAHRPLRPRRRRGARRRAVASSGSRRCPSGRARASRRRGSRSTSRARSTWGASTRSFSARRSAEAVPTHSGPWRTTCYEMRGGADRDREVLRFLRDGCAAAVDVRVDAPEPDASRKASPSRRTSPPRRAPPPIHSGQRRRALRPASSYEPQPMSPHPQGQAPGYAGYAAATPANPAPAYPPYPAYPAAGRRGLRRVPGSTLRPLPPTFRRSSSAPACSSSGPTGTAIRASCSRSRPGTAWSGSPTGSSGGSSSAYLTLAR